MRTVDRLRSRFDMVVMLDNGGTFTTPQRSKQSWWGHMAWHRTSRHKRGYNSRWDRIRIQVLKRDRHLCQVCEAAGRVTVATEVDHIIPKAQGGTDDMSNLSSICAPCHRAKTARENGRDWRETGVDGWPVE